MLNLRKKDELRNSSCSRGMVFCLGTAIPAESVVGIVGFDPVDMAEDGFESSSVTLP
jgi:hypothetical protein